MLYVGSCQESFKSKRTHFRPLLRKFFHGSRIYDGLHLNHVNVRLLFAKFRQII